MKLSHRLETIASFVRRGSIIADIGTDHGYIPIYLVKEGISPRALAMDVRKGPLERAKRHVHEYGLEDRICLRQSDGLHKLEAGEAVTIVIAGMGGELMVRILEEGRHVFESTERLILSPQSEPGNVRRFLETNGFCILRETMVRDEGKYYTVIEAGHGMMKYSRDCFYEYGRCLIEEKNGVFAGYLEKEKKTVEELIEKLSQNHSESARRRLMELKERQKIIKEAQDEMQGTD